MPKKFKGENTKVSAAKERKAAHKAEINSKIQAEKERKEAEEWAKGAKDSSKREAERLKKEAQLAKKREAAALLEKEEKEASKYKPILKPSKVSGEEKKAIKRTQKVEEAITERRVIPEYSASNIDDAIDLLNVVAAEDTVARGSGGGANILPLTTAAIDRHPERRFKAALAAYEEREMPKLKKENPGLRYTQLRDILYKDFQKSPENPFNQANVLHFNATKKEQEELVEATRKEVEDRLRLTAWIKEKLRNQVKNCSGLGMKEVPDKSILILDFTSLSLNPLSLYFESILNLEYQLDL
ncbi:6379_t:CDS:2 [Ambispora leptoticha]|uniref:6379_t:CDS:1 n=1 Tax=Ambispora leptoticha TaxID=144679 RepID=A0A9N8WFU4_9GLOM|nr:6379_t:CDS:2 [Ambispora leptoticha]